MERERAPPTNEPQQHMMERETTYFSFREATVSERGHSAAAFLSEERPRILQTRVSKYTHTMLSERG